MFLRAHLKTSILLLAILVTLNVFASVMRDTRSPNPVLKGFTEGCQGKAQPCWYGIVPGLTSEPDAIRQITSYNMIVENATSYGGYQVKGLNLGCEIYLVIGWMQTSITEIHFRNCDGIGLGNVIFLIQSTGSIYFDPCEDSIHLGYPGIGTYFTIPNSKLDLLDLRSEYPIVAIHLHTPQKWQPDYETDWFNNLPHPSKAYLKRWHILRIVDWTNGCG